MAAGAECHAGIEAHVAGLRVRRFVPARHDPQPADPDRRELRLGLPHPVAVLELAGAAGRQGAARRSPARRRRARRRYRPWHRAGRRRGCCATREPTARGPVRHRPPPRPGCRCRHPRSRPKPHRRRAARRPRRRAARKAASTRFPSSACSVPAPPAVPARAAGGGRSCGGAAALSPGWPSSRPAAFPGSGCWCRPRRTSASTISSRCSGMLV